MRVKLTNWFINVHHWMELRWGYFVLVVTCQKCKYWGDHPSQPINQNPTALVANKFCGKRGSVVYGRTPPPKFGCTAGREKE